MKKAAVYIRVSTEEQAKDGYSLDAQLKSIKSYAQINNIEIDKQFIFKDKGISGKTVDKRPAFIEMIKQAKCKPKKFDVILVHKMDRFSRNREDSIVYKSLLKKECNIPVISITEPIDPNDKMGVIIEAFLEAMAEYYSINLSSEVKKGQIEKHNHGQLQTRPSLGYDVASNRLVINKEEAAIVKMIFNLFIYKKKSINNITRTINKLGFKTKNANRFQNRSVKYILTNPTYIGKLTYTINNKKIIVNGKHSGIIDKKIWNEAQERIKTNEKYKTNKYQSNVYDKQISPFKGLIRCFMCNSTLVKYGKNCMRCNGYNKGSCNNRNKIPINLLEDLVLNQLQEDFKNNSIILYKSQVLTNSKDQYNSLLGKISEINKEKERINQAYLEGIDSIEEYKKKKLLVQKQENAVNTKLNKIVNRKETIKKEKIELKSITELLKNNDLSPKQKNEIYHIIIKEIEFYPDNNILKLKYN